MKDKFTQQRSLCVGVAVLRCLPNVHCLKDFHSPGLQVPSLHPHLLAEPHYVFPPQSVEMNRLVWLLAVSTGAPCAPAPQGCSSGIWVLELRGLGADGYSSGSLPALWHNPSHWSRSGGSRVAW